jgi:Cu/Ag efflux protein CusF
MKNAIVQKVNLNLNSKKDRRMEMRIKKVSRMRLFSHKDSSAVFAVLALLLTLTSCASVSAPPPAETSSASAYQEGVPGGIIVNTLDVSARVTAIDMANRKVTLLGPDGETFTVKVGPAAVNFDQVGVGDWVNLTVTEELVVYLNEGNEAPSDESAAAVVLAPKGAKPGGLVAETTQITGTVTAIDLEKRTATLQFQDGSTRTFPVRSDVDLSKRKVGEQVVFRITEMIAISVKKP